MRFAGEEGEGDAAGWESGEDEPGSVIYDW